MVIERLPEALMALPHFLGLLVFQLCIVTIDLDALPRALGQLLFLVLSNPLLARVARLLAVDQLLAQIRDFLLLGHLAVEESLLFLLPKLREAAVGLFPAVLTRLARWGAGSILSQETMDRQCILARGALFTLAVNILDLFSLRLHLLSSMNQKRYGVSHVVVGGDNNVAILFRICHYLLFGKLNFVLFFLV